jgi:ankyrin repeat protein
MLEKGAAINAPNNHGDTPLHRAATLPQATRLLIEKGAVVNAAAVDGQTPLHYAILKRNEEGRSPSLYLLLP